MNKIPVKGRINAKHARQDEDQGAPSPVGPKKLRIHRIAATARSQENVPNPKILGLLDKVGFEGVAPDRVSRNKSVGYAPHNSMVFLLVCEKGFENNNQCTLIKIANGGPEEQIGHGRVLAKSGCVDPQCSPGSIDIRLMGEATIMDLIVHADLNLLPTPPPNGATRILLKVEPDAKRIPPLSPAPKLATALPGAVKPTTLAPAPIPVHAPKPDPIVIPPDAKPPRLAAPSQSVPATSAPRNGNGDYTQTSTVQLKVSEIQRFAAQPRKEFDLNEIRHLGESLRQDDQQTDIIVTPVEGVPGIKWELVDGERRWRSAVAAGVMYLSGKIRIYKDKNEQFWASFIANWNRCGHTPIETSQAIKKAMDGGKTAEQIVVATGKYLSWVYHHLMLQKLCPQLQDQMMLKVPKASRLRFGVAQVLARVEDYNEQVRIWNDCKSAATQGLIKLAVERRVQAFLKEKPQGHTAGRKINPSDRARRAHRMVLTLETGVEFLTGFGQEEIDLIVNGESGGPPEAIAKRFEDAAKFLSEFAEKIRKTPQKVSKG